MMVSEQQLTEEEFQAIARHLDALVQEFEALPFPDVREKVFDLLQAVDALHRVGLGRLIGFLHDHGQAGLVERAAADPVIRELLLLYDMVPADEAAQAEAAIEIIRPYIHSHGGQVEILDVVDGIVHLRLSGACHGCAGSTVTLKRGLEAALRDGFPGFKGMQVHSPVASPGRECIPLVQADQGPQRQVRRPIFKTIARLQDVPVGTMRAFEVEGVRALVANVQGEIYAVRATCPGSMAPLELGSFAPPIVICPWHNEAYDIRTGRRADGQAQPALAILPIAVIDGCIQVAVNTLPDTDVPVQE